MCVCVCVCECVCRHSSKFGKQLVTCLEINAINSIYNFQSINQSVNKSINFISIYLSSYVFNCSIIVSICCLSIYNCIILLYLSIILYVYLLSKYFLNFQTRSLSNQHLLDKLCFSK